MRCANCGREIRDGSKFCPYCGKQTVVQAQGNEYQRQGYKDSNERQNSNPGTRPYYNSPEVTENQLPEKFRPISMWGYFGYELLFAIPFVGLIILIVFCFTATNQNLKNFARSHFCFLMIVLVIAIIAAAVAGGTALGFGMMGLH